MKQGVYNFWTDLLYTCWLDYEAIPYHSRDTRATVHLGCAKDKVLRAHDRVPAARSIDAHGYGIVLAVVAPVNLELEAPSTIGLCLPQRGCIWGLLVRINVVDCGDRDAGALRVKAAKSAELGSVGRATDRYRGK